MDRKQIAKPKLASEWKLLYRPTKFGIYVNDHSLIKANDGKWYLFGITCMTDDGRPNMERYFTYGSTDSLDTPMTELGKVIDEGLCAWAPAVIEHNGLYFMFYGPNTTRMAVTHDPSHWMGHQINLRGVPFMAVHRDHMVIPYQNGWLMYASGVKDGYGCVSLLQSDDLVNWDFKGYALTSSGDAPLTPPWGAFESPFVIKHGDLYYMFVTYTDSGIETYHNTYVFCSPDPTNFGDYTKSNHDETVIAELPVHAGEVVSENGKYYITTAGWNGYNVPFEGGVAIAELTFEK